jgi:hypothetical protein
MTSLRSLYVRYWPVIVELRTRYPDLSPPLLVDPPDAYWEQPIRLCIIGQQTQSWWNKRLGTVRSTTQIDTLLRIYKYEFNMAIATPRGGYFWQFVRKLEQTLGLRSGAVVWSNLNKMDQADGRPTRPVERELSEKLPLLPIEVQELKPNAVLFLTGPDYDDLLIKLFNGAQFNPFRRGEFPVSRVAHHALPIHTYRTYHPGYLRRSGLWSNVLDHIASQYQELSSP